MESCLRIHKVDADVVFPIPAVELDDGPLYMGVALMGGPGRPDTPHAGDWIVDVASGSDLVYSTDQITTHKGPLTHFEVCALVAATLAAKGAVPKHKARFEIFAQDANLMA